MQNYNKTRSQYSAAALSYPLRTFVLATFLFFSSTVAANNAQQNDLQFALESLSLPLMNEVNKVYESRNYNLLWSDGSKYNGHAHNLIKVIQDARKLGLNPADYDLEVIEYFMESTIDDPAILSKSDVTFTHAYVKLASHIKNNNISDELHNKYELFNNDNFLTDIHEKKSQTISTPTVTKSLQENTNHYSRLLNALEKYRSLNDDFEPIILQKKSLTIADASPEISKVRKRLYELGDYLNTDLSNDFFDESLAIAISDFQHRHGLEADGILGKRTVREINKSVEQRAIQLEVNLDRAKQISEFDDSRYILVNVPEYKLYVIEHGQTIFETRVVVGKKKHKTPVITSEISHFVLNPYWNIPTSITKNEIIPKLQEDPQYLANNDMKIISRLNNQNIVIDPEFVDWANIDSENAPLRIRQDPGSKNALGRVKFIFPNNYKVYLHDTPSRRLFLRNSRAFSHGCVRVENPFELAKVLISNSETWTSEKLNYFANRTKTKTVKLDKPIPIHITYMTAWADEQNIIHFRPDIYKRDSHIASTLYNASN